VAAAAYRDLQTLATAKIDCPNNFRHRPISVGRLSTRPLCTRRASS